VFSARKFLGKAQVIFRRRVARPGIEWRLDAGFARGFSMAVADTTETILIVEDNEIEREGMAVVLRQAGYAAVIAPSTDVALAYPECNRPPALILLDMMMPGKDGWQFLQERKKKPALASVPIVIVTGVGVASQEWAESLGAVGVLIKRFDTKVLLREVGRHCRPGQPVLEN
jgi:CheY-like chemotaxis protein